MTAILWQTQSGTWQVLTDNGSSVAATCDTESQAIKRAKELGYRVLFSSGLL